MDPPDAGFEKIEETDNRMHGPRKLLVCGFPVGDQPTLTAALAGAGLGTWSLSGRWRPRQLRPWET